MDQDGTSGGRYNPGFIKKVRPRVDSGVESGAELEEGHRARVIPGCMLGWSGDSYRVDPGVEPGVV